jgi:drug/metabolite transporter (DMT)-like permease
MSLSSGGLPPRAGVAIAIVLWGISFVATKAALREVSPVTLVFTRFALGALLLGGVLVARGLPILPPRDTWMPLAGMAFIGVFVHQMLQATALQYTSAMHTGWLIGVIPIWSAILAGLFLGERLRPAQLAGLAIGFAGALLGVTRGRFGPGTFGLPSTRGDLLVLASTLNWAIYTVIGHGILRRLGPTRATAGIMTLGCLMLAVPFVWSSGWREYHALSADGWGAVAFLGIGCSGMGYLFWYGALEKIEASRDAEILYFEPYVTLIAAAIVLGEPVTGTAVAGGLLVLAGVMMVQSKAASTRTPE